MNTKREFYIDTPLGKLRVWAKHETDSPEDYPGVFVDLVDPSGNGEDLMLGCIEFDSADRSLLGTLYGNSASDEPTDLRYFDLSAWR